MTFYDELQLERRLEAMDLRMDGLDARLEYLEEQLALIALKLFPKGPADDR